MANRIVKKVNMSDNLKTAKNKERVNSNTPMEQCTKAVSKTGNHMEKES